MSSRGKSTSSKQQYISSLVVIQSCLAFSRQVSLQAFGVRCKVLYIGRRDVCEWIVLFFSRTRLGYLCGKHIWKTSWRLAEQWTWITQLCTAAVYIMIQSKMHQHVINICTDKRTSEWILLSSTIVEHLTLHTFSEDFVTVFFSPIGEMNQFTAYLHKHLSELCSPLLSNYLCLCWEYLSFTCLVSISLSQHLKASV